MVLNLFFVFVGLMIVAGIVGIYKVVGILWQTKNKTQQIFYTAIAIIGAVSALAIFGYVFGGICPPYDPAEPWTRCNTAWWIR